MLFRLNKNYGQHRQNDKDYKVGDSVESDVNLAKMFPGKFTLTSIPVEQERVLSAPIIPDPVAIKGSATSETALPEPTKPIESVESESIKSEK